MNAKKHQMPVVLFLTFLLISLVTSCGKAPKDHDAYNTYKPGSFPAVVSDRVFEIPLDPSSLLVVVPDSLEHQIPELGRRLAEMAGGPVSMRGASAVQAKDLGGKHLILLGNIMNNRWLLEMYRKRRAYADAYFPGAGGWIIHPAKSLWDRARNVLVIGVSSEGDLEAGWAAFLEQLPPDAKAIGVVHLLKTAHGFPQPPESIEPALGPTKKDVRERPPYMTVAQWGFMYFFTGDKRWAGLFRDGMAVLHRRAETSGKWITEPWSNVYFILWNLFHAWELIDDDLFFNLEERQIIEDVLYGYTMYIHERPYLDKGLLLPDEPRQNHYTFLALSLDAAYRYYTEKYKLTGLEAMADKVRRCLDRGQASSYRPNDDGGAGYQVLAPSHYLYYALGKGDLSFLESGRLRTLVDLIAATTDNRGDPVTFGDIGGYSHRKPGEPQRDEVQFPSLAAWYYKEGAYQWLSNWLDRDSVIDLEPRGPVGAGLYATDLKEAPPLRFLGILPVILDEASLRWSSHRSARPSEVPLAGGSYFDKISFRRRFDPDDEYLLLDGTSTFAHGHLDGNTVTRLTWKDRVWLADLDYIKDGPQEHNGVSVVRDGVQDAPPPLNRLDALAEFDGLGVTRTTAADYNGAEWQRHIVWRKGRYFLFLDRVIAGKPGFFRLENRWRLRGDVTLEGNTTAVRQGDRDFFIRSADAAPRSLRVVPDEIYSHWDYPYGPAATTVCLAEKNIGLAANSAWTFANLLYATAEGAKDSIGIRRAGENLYVVDDSGSREFIGLDAQVLEKAGISTDGSLFVQAGGRLFIVDLSRCDLGHASLQSTVRFSLEFGRKNRTASMLVPAEGDFFLQGVKIPESVAALTEGGRHLHLKPGQYVIRFSESAANVQNLDGLLGKPAAVILPEPVRTKAMDFGLEVQNRVESPAETTAACLDGENVLFGTKTGAVYKIEAGKMEPFFSLSSGKEVLALQAADINQDGQREILSSDGASNLFCFDATGRLLWKLVSTPFFGRDANITGITVDDIDGRGTMTILAATNGWKLYAINPDGGVRWESFIYYHPLTKVRVLKNKSKTLIAVGTIYQTPLNVVDPATGVVIWKTWEQTGSETMSTTDYCGKVLRDMVFVDTDGDNEKEIVFGNESHTIYALSAADGKTKWKTQVGDKVSVIKILAGGRGRGERILAGTEAGEVYLLNVRGRRLMMNSLGSGITGLEVINYEQRARPDVLFSTADGRVGVFDDGFVFRASLDTGMGPIKSIFLARRTDGEERFYAVGGRQILEISYRPYFLRPSRHY